MPKDEKQLKKADAITAIRWYLTDPSKRSIRAAAKMFGLSNTSLQREFKRQNEIIPIDLDIVKIENPCFENESPENPSNGNGSTDCSRPKHPKKEQKTNKQKEKKRKQNEKIVAAVRWYFADPETRAIRAAADKFKVSNTSLQREIKRFKSLVKDAGRESSTEENQENQENHENQEIHQQVHQVKVEYVEEKDSSEQFENEDCDSKRELKKIVKRMKKEKPEKPQEKDKYQKKIEIFAAAQWLLEKPEIRSIRAAAHKFKVSNTSLQRELKRLKTETVREFTPLAMGRRPLLTHKFETIIRENILLCQELGVFLEKHQIVTAIQELAKSQQLKVPSKFPNHMLMHRFFRKYPECDPRNVESMRDEQQVAYSLINYTQAECAQKLQEADEVFEKNGIPYIVDIVRETFNFDNMIMRKIEDVH